MGEVGDVELEDQRDENRQGLDVLLAAGQVQSRRILLGVLKVGGMKKGLAEMRRHELIGEGRKAGDGREIDTVLGVAGSSDNRGRELADFGQGLPEIVRGREKALEELVDDAGLRVGTRRRQHSVEARQIQPLGIEGVEQRGREKGRAAVGPDRVVLARRAARPSQGPGGYSGQWHRPLTRGNEVEDIEAHEVRTIGSAEIELENPVAEHVGAVSGGRSEELSLGIEDDRGVGPGEESGDDAAGRFAGARRPDEAGIGLGTGHDGIERPRSLETEGDSRPSAQRGLGGGEGSEDRAGRPSQKRGEGRRSAPLGAAMGVPGLAVRFGSREGREEKADGADEHSVDGLVTDRSRGRSLDW